MVVTGARPAANGERKKAFRDVPWSGVSVVA